ncbi:VOC family protein [Cryobacterium psychrophilum]|uniref:VOC family protein n=1 Tax=Cryobacterium psychrophilum TaxID=41988 RepID=A0A4Y8KTQ0_9MICO|nr:VOC family protein [Cryobacterium psychrophilum]TDW29768.1 glyoxalase/bleomycin resistance protein/dioxygenase superfamily protein [Cryobacterium psychrophilum]TFD81868.1 VOC family protein [Cryobacterium psychrophilum]
MTVSLGIQHAFGGFAVNDIEAAVAFYGETLGLEVRQGQMGMLRLQLPGGAEMIIYPKPDHEPANFTILNLVVANIDVAVDELTERGVEFLRYDGVFEQDVKGIQRGGDPEIAWFTDPAGNILSVLHTT